MLPELEMIYSKEIKDSALRVNISGTFTQILSTAYNKVFLCAYILENKIISENIDIVH